MNIESFLRLNEPDFLDRLPGARPLHERHEPRIITVSTSDCVDRGFVRQLFGSAAETTATPDYSPVKWEVAQ